jgi:hypothetical protein
MHKIDKYQQERQTSGKQLIETLSTQNKFLQRPAAYGGLRTVLLRERSLFSLCNTLNLNQMGK